VAAGRGLSTALGRISTVPKKKRLARLGHRRPWQRVDAVIGDPAPSGAGSRNLFLEVRFALGVRDPYLDQGLPRDARGI